MTTKVVKAAAVAWIVVAALGCSSSNGKPSDGAAGSVTDAKDGGGTGGGGGGGTGGAPGTVDAMDALHGTDAIDATDTSSTTASDAREGGTTDSSDMALPDALDDMRASSDGSDATDTIADASDANDANAAPDATDASADVMISTVCGHNVNFFSACNALCNDLENNCSDAANRQFATFTACMDQCMVPTWSCGSPGDVSGNTVFCRDTHAAAAATAADKAAECQNGGPNSTACR